MAAATAQGSFMGEMGFELAHEEAAQLQLDLAGAHPHRRDGGAVAHHQADANYSYETISERCTIDGIYVSCLRCNETGAFSWSWHKEGNRPRAGFATEQEALADAALRCPYCGGELADYPRRDGRTTFTAAGSATTAPPDLPPARATLSLAPRPLIPLPPRRRNRSVRPGGHPREDQQKEHHSVPGVAPEQ